MKRQLSFLMVIALFVSNTGYAQAKRVMSDPYARTISEFFYSRTGDEILAPVRILGGVEWPGIYHVPTNTDLATLISISGGASSDADVHNIKFTRSNAKTKEIDLYDHVEKGKEILLGGGDTIYVPKKEGWISNETATFVLVLVSVLSLGLTAYTVDRSD